MVIHNKDICQTAHGTAHTERTEDERPHDFVEKIAGAGHDEDADSEEDDFCDEGIQIEEEKWADVFGRDILGSEILSEWDNMLWRVLCVMDPFYLRP
ncbi:hypothetical protein AnigIFM60653_002795 [Aspergillus niger]|nr:hypothetical protein AnigIFM60653_002795 [Aspergillus niger]